MESMLRWLMDWPAGLKLNRELGMLFGNLFLWLIQLWTGGSEIMHGNGLLFTIIPSEFERNILGSSN